MIARRNCAGFKHFGLKSGLWANDREDLEVKY